MDFHPIANCFPLIEGREFDELVDDVRAHGVHEPIIIFEGMILDGRNRYRASEIAGVDCPMVPYEGNDAVGFVVSLNLRRRHLNEGQRAWVAAQIANLAHGQKSETQICASPVTNDRAAEMLNVSPRSVDNARVVRDKGVPELQQKVAKGEVAPSTAADVARLPEPEQREIVAKGEKEILKAAKEIRAQKVQQRINEARRDYEARKEQGGHAEDLLALVRDGKRFQVIYADPPWEFSVYSGKGAERSAERHYDTMTLEQIAKLPIADLADENCALFVWAVMPELPGAIDLIRKWGFVYKTVAFTWVKQNRSGEGLFTGMGYWTRANAEVCLLATRGAPQRLAMDVHQVIMAPVREHSRKPDETVPRIERLLAGPYIELFARETRPGWTTWGNEVRFADELAA